MTREELMEMILFTRTQEDAIETQQARDVWMEKQPDDQGVGRDSGPLRA